MHFMGKTPAGYIDRALHLKSTKGRKPLFKMARSLTMEAYTHENYVHIVIVRRSTL